MVISDRARAARYLTHINYYRLRAYWLPFEASDSGSGHRFKPRTVFDDALTLYIFDRKFRLLVLEAIERVEVSFRTRFAYELSLKYGSHAYMDASIFHNAEYHRQHMETLREEIDRSRETFIEHYNTTYDDPPMPPIWAVCEVMSFGQLSKWFKNLKHRGDRQTIARVFNLDEIVLGSFMHHLTHVRNLVAHHSRLWNRRLVFTMTLPKRPPELVSLFNKKADRYIYNTIAMLAYLLTLISPGTTWPGRMRQLIEENAAVNPASMGFPDSWKSLKLWDKAS